MRNQIFWEVAGELWKIVLDGLNTELDGGLGFSRIHGFNSGCGYQV
jgi:hypothetical protein